MTRKWLAEGQKQDSMCKQDQILGPGEDSFGHGIWDMRHFGRLKSGISNQVSMWGFDYWEEQEWNWGDQLEPNGGPKIMTEEAGHMYDLISNA